MVNQAANQYLVRAVQTATPAELTLMLYEGAIKFTNIALIALEKSDMPKTNEYLKKAQKIIMELRVTLNHKYPVWKDFENVYEYIYNQLVDGNLHKDREAIEEALKYTREMRDTWKEVMKLNKGSSK